MTVVMVRGQPIDECELAERIFLRGSSSVNPVDFSKRLPLAFNALTPIFRPDRFRGQVLENPAQIMIENI